MTPQREVCRRFSPTSWNVGGRFGFQTHPVRITLTDTAGGFCALNAVLPLHGNPHLARFSLILSAFKLHVYW